MTKARDLANAADVLDDVSATELSYVNGVTSAIQTQIDGKQAVVSGVNDTEIGYLDGVSSAIQTQLDAKTAKSTLTTTGDIYYASSANTPARLGIGSTGNVLTVASGVPSWAAPSTSGLAFITSASFTTSGAVNINNVFTSTYTNYKIVFYYSAFSATSLHVDTRMRASGTDTTSGYYDIRVKTTNGNAVNAYENQQGTGLWSGFDIFGSSPSGVQELDIYNPQLARNTYGFFRSFSKTGTDNTFDWHSLFLNDTTAYDGISFFPSTGTMTGEYKIYGYSNS